MNKMVLDGDKGSEKKKKKDCLKSLKSKQPEQAKTGEDLTCKIRDRYWMTASCVAFLLRVLFCTLPKGDV